MWKPDQVLFPQGLPAPTCGSVGITAASECWASLLSFASSSWVPPRSTRGIFSRMAALRGWNIGVSLWLDPGLFISSMWEDR